MSGLHFGIDLRKRFGRDFAVHGFEDGLALGRTEFFDDVRQIGRMQALQFFVRDVQTKTPQRVGFDDIAELPADGVR